MENWSSPPNIARGVMQPWLVALMSLGSNFDLLGGLLLFCVTDWTHVAVWTSGVLFRISSLYTMHSLKNRS